MDISDVKRYRSLPLLMSPGQPSIELLISGMKQEMCVQDDMVERQRELSFLKGLADT